MKTVFQSSGIPGIVCLIFFSSCQNYFKVKDGSSALKPDSVIQADANRYFILRSGDEAFYMSDPRLTQDRKFLFCRLNILPADHQLNLYHGIGGHMRYKKHKADTAVLSEVHFYIPIDTNVRARSSYMLDLGKVEKIEILVKDKGRTTRSYIMGGIGITMGVVVVAAIIALALKSSCPFVSANNGNGLILQGEIYGGAIYPQLARNDYLPLQMTPLSDGTLQVRISNELKERQYTDLAELMVITHRKNVQMRVDEHGNLYSISNPELPLSACSGEKNTLDQLKKAGDRSVFAFDDTLQQQGNQLDLCFKKPEHAKNVKLILQLKNSYWLDMVYGKMTEGFGSYYAKFIRKQHNRPVADLKRWVKEQQLPLSVSLKTDNGWKHIEDITTFGPLANRELVVPVKLDSISSNTFTIRLSCGFMFWELDYAAVDFSTQADYTVNFLTPKKAIDEKGQDVTELISKADGKLMEQPVPGNAADIEYAFTPNTDSSLTQTFILHAKGYYEHVRNYQGSPRIAFLKQFEKPDALSKYSFKLYQDAMTGDIQNLPADKLAAIETKTVTR